MTDSSFADYLQHLLRFIRRPPKGPELDAQFNELSLELFRLQFHQSEIYRAFCEARGATLADITSWREIPALPAAAFKAAEVTTIPESERTDVFYSSGSTSQSRSAHFHSRESLGVYETSACAAFEINFNARLKLHPGLKEAEPSWIFLTPTSDLAPHSSLVRMFAFFDRRFASRSAIFLGTVEDDSSWSVNPKLFSRAIENSIIDQRPIVLMGSAFLFVQLLDRIGARDITLPGGSLVLETGGYKGKTRSIPKPDFYKMLSEAFGISTSDIFGEYGMSELSSQGYDAHSAILAPGERTFAFPPWARVRVISPETSREVASGEKGFLQIIDLANVRSVVALQTEDWGRTAPGGFLLEGRPVAAEPRGCSLMAR